MLCLSLGVWGFWNLIFGGSDVGFCLGIFFRYWLDVGFVYYEDNEYLRLNGVVLRNIWYFNLSYFVSFI